MNSAKETRSPKTNETGSETNLEKRLKRQVIGKPHRFIAVVPLGFEKTLVEELAYVGVECVAGSDDVENRTEREDCVAGSDDVENRTEKEDCVAGIKVAGDGKVEFTAKLTEAWKAVAYSRIANRILMEIASFKAENFGQLEKGVSAVPWELYLSAPYYSERSAANATCHPERSVAKSKDLANKSLVIHVTCKHSRLYHSDAVEERIRKVIGPRSGSQNLYVTLQDDRCTLWLDLAGEELYKRGHERFVAEAPLKETIAAAMIFEAAKLTTNHQPLTTILDGMAGSGTFSLEAAYIANGLIPGKCRDFALKHQPAFKEGTWNFILKGTDVIANDATNVIASDNVVKQSEQNRPAVTIITSDISQRPIDIIRHNAENSPLPDGIITPQLKDFFSYTVEDFVQHHPATQSSVINSQSSIINHQSSVINSQSSIINHQSSVINSQSSIINHQSSIILLNPPYGKRLAFDAPKLYTKIGQQLTRWSRDAQSRNINLIVAILSPKDDSRDGVHYNCTENLQKACPALDPRKNSSAKVIATSHGGFSLNAIFAKI